MSRERATLLGLPLPTVCWFLAFLGAVDLWTTHLLLSAGLGREFNPLMLWIYERGGAPAMALVKAAFMAPCLLWIACRAPLDHARAASLVALSIYFPVTLLHIAGLVDGMPL